MERTYRIEVDCANCANKMELAAAKTPGVKAVSVNFMAQKMTVAFQDGCDVSAVMKDVRKNCRKVEDDIEVYL